MTTLSKRLSASTNPGFIVRDGAGMSSAMQVGMHTCIGVRRLAGPAYLLNTMLLHFSCCCSYSAAARSWQA